jgi:hypothetical protein
VQAPRSGRRALNIDAVATGREEANPALPSGDKVIVGVGEARDLCDAVLVVDADCCTTPAFLIGGENPSVALVVAGVGDLPRGCLAGETGGEARALFV